MSGKLSTHVLDNYLGKPAANVAWTLEYFDYSGAWTQLAQGITNRDGRTDEPLLLDESLQTGKYRLKFGVGAYYNSLEIALPSLPFLDIVPIEVSLLSGENYHVPLLMTPWSYSTYRGS
ncbi:hydroxyisourate hydrolase [Puniceicoccaceae bacterium K14]|nr:hydroxyisourate hydrolase [Puniceicoccaceae bacterium K14]